MSKRVITKTKITDITLASAALKRLGVRFKAAGPIIEILSGDLCGAQIDTRSGGISHDDEFHPMSAVELVHETYTEEKLKVEILKNGGSIVERSTNKNGEIVLLYQVA